MAIRLLALDIDGTLVPEHTNQVSEALKVAILEATLHVHVALVSARAAADLLIVMNELGLQGRYHVLENGTKIMNPQGEIERTLYLPRVEVLEIIDMVKDSCQSVGYCIEGQWLSYLPSSSDDVVTTLSLVVKKEIAPDLKSKIQELVHEYALTIGNHWSDSTLSVILISHREASKGGGLKYLQQVLGVTPDDTIAVGDGGSDIPMFQQAAVKVAMGNAEEQLKRVATHQVSSVQEDGVVEVIKKFILK